jgi:hypothetical protein
MRDGFLPIRDAAIENFFPPRCRMQRMFERLSYGIKSSDVVA